MILNLKNILYNIASEWFLVSQKQIYLIWFDILNMNIPVTWIFLPLNGIASGVASYHYPVIIQLKLNGLVFIPPLLHP